MAAASYLLFHRGGGLWGIESGRVLRIGPGRSSDEGADPEEKLRIELSHAEGPRALAADRVEGVVENLAVRPLSPAVHRFWPEACLGWALYSGRPVVLLDPVRPPHPLVVSGGSDA